MSLNENFDLFSYFNKMLKEFLSLTDSAVSEESVFYLSQLLVNRSQMKEEYPETLAELRFMALEGNQRQAISAYKEMGDRALFISGFFRGSFRNQIVNVDYYYSMGSMAYASLQTLIGSLFFEELSRRFVFFSEILRDISLYVSRSKIELISIYNAWLKSKDPRLALRLRLLGFSSDALIIA